jgi:hypothetical protein
MALSSLKLDNVKLRKVSDSPGPVPTATSSSETKTTKASSVASSAIEPDSKTPMQLPMMFFEKMLFNVPVISSTKRPLGSVTNSHIIVFQTSLHSRLTQIVRVQLTLDNIFDEVGNSSQPRDGWKDKWIFLRLNPDNKIQLKSSIWKSLFATEQSVLHSDEFTSLPNALQWSQDESPSFVVKTNPPDVMRSAKIPEGFVEAWLSHWNVLQPEQSGITPYRMMRVPNSSASVQVFKIEWDSSWNNEDQTLLPRFVDTKRYARIHSGLMWYSKKGKPESELLRLSFNADDWEQELPVFGQFKVIPNRETNKQKWIAEGDHQKLWSHEDMSVLYQLWQMQDIPFSMSIDEFQTLMTSITGQKAIEWRNAIQSSQAGNSPAIEQLWVFHLTKGWVPSAFYRRPTYEFEEKPATSTDSSPAFQYLWKAESKTTFIPQIDFSTKWNSTAWASCSFITINKKNLIWDTIAKTIKSSEFAEWVEKLLAFNPEKLLQLEKVNKPKLGTPGSKNQAFTVKSSASSISAEPIKTLSPDLQSKADILNTMIISPNDRIVSELAVESGVEHKDNIVKNFFKKLNGKNTFDIWSWRTARNEYRCAAAASGTGQFILNTKGKVMVAFTSDSLKMELQAKLDPTLNPPIPPSLW